MRLTNPLDYCRYLHAFLFSSPLHLLFLSHMYLLYVVKRLVLYTPTKTFRYSHCASHQLNSTQSPTIHLPKKQTIQSTMPPHSFPWPLPTSASASYALQCHCAAIQFTIKLSPPLLESEAQGEGVYTAIECDCTHCETKGIIACHPKMADLKWEKGREVCFLSFHFASLNECYYLRTFHRFIFLVTRRVTVHSLFPRLVDPLGHSSIDPLID